MKYNREYIISNGFLNKRSTLKYDKYFFEIVNDFNKNNSFGDDLRWSNMVYNYIENIKKPPLCMDDKCNNEVTYISFHEGYKRFCSKKCGLKSPLTKIKRKKTNLEKYGYETPLKSKLIIEKKKKTNLEKYGVENYVESDDFKSKNNNTILKKYGVSHIGKSKEIREKIKKTNLSKFGVENPFSNKEIRKKIKNTNLERYGVETFLKSKEIREKIKETNLSKFGVENPFSNKEIQKKIRRTNLERYGVDNVSKLKKNRIKIISVKNNNALNKWCEKLDIDLKKITYNNNTKTYSIFNLCEIHDFFEIKYDDLYNRIVQSKIKNPCTKCNPISKQISISEKEIYEILSQKFEVLNKDKKVLNGRELDIYLPKHKLGIEYNGLYWHSEIYKSNDYHLNKLEECEKKGVKLVHIFEDEWIDKKEIVMSIITSKLNKYENTIYSEQCDIKEISTDESEEFLEKNHILGNFLSKINIGLFYKNELISLMSFGENKKNQYEIHRFCSELPTHAKGDGLGFGSQHSY